MTVPLFLPKRRTFVHAAVLHWQYSHTMFLRLVSSRYQPHFWLALTPTLNLYDSRRPHWP